jgi:outer membrane protein assembly factor BamB
MKLKLLYTLVLSCGLVTLAPAQNWPRFRGPNGTGIAPDRGLPTELSRAKNVVWSVKTPPGHSSPIVINGRVFLTAHDGDQRVVLCYDAVTGKQRWQKSITKARTEFFHAVNGPTTPTPTSDGRHLFVFFPEFGLLAYDQNGKELWRTPLGPFASIQGLAASPIVTDGYVILLVDTPDEAYLAAFDTRTGKQSWRVERPTGILGSYATPTLYRRVGEPTQIIVAGATELTGYEAKTGARLWWAPGVTIAPCAPPFVAGDSVYTVEPAGLTWPSFSTPLSQFDTNHNGRIELTEVVEDSGWLGSLKSVDKNLGNNDGSVTQEEYAKTSVAESSGGLIRIRLGGRGEVSRNVVWRQTKGWPTHTGGLLYQHILYLVRSGILMLFDPETGTQQRQERIKDALGDYYASPIAADGKIYLISQEGKATVLKAGSEPQVLSTNDLSEEVIATPAIANKHIYLRTEETLFCFGTGKK